MSSLTKCNHCTLLGIERAAAMRGATVTTYQQTLAEVRAAGLDDLDGWIEVRVSDEPKPVAYFKALTTHCAC